MIELFTMIDTYMSEPVRFMSDRWQLMWMTIAMFFICFAICYFIEEIFVVKTDEYYIRKAKERIEKENKKCKN